MVRAFFRMVELFLALTLLFSVISTLQVNNAAGYTDPDNTLRLYDNAKRIALSYNARRAQLVRGVLENVSGNVPGDIEYKVLLYSNSTGHALNTLVNQTGYQVPENKTIATYSLLVSGSITNSSVHEYAPRRLVVMTWNA